MIGLRRIINNTIISLLGQGVSWVSTFLLSVAYGRFLGAFAFGELYLAITFVSLIGTPIDSGYSNQIVRDLAQKPENASRYFTNVLLIKLGTWLIMFAAILLISWPLGYTSEVRMLIAICGFDLLCNALANTFASLHYAFERAIYPVVGNILEKGLTALLGFLLLRSGAGVQVMAVVLVGGSLINAIWQAIWYFRLVGTSFVIDPKFVGEIVRTNIPFLIVGVLGVGYTSIDTVLLSLMANSTVVGLYGAASRITDMMGFLPSIVIMNIMYPVFSKLATTSDAEMKLALEKSMNIMLFCSIPLTTMLIVAAPNIVGFLYGSGFIRAVPALQALAPYVIFLYINYAFLVILLSKKQDRKMPIIAGVALAFNLGLNLVLIPLFQHIGSAIVTSITELLLCCIAVFVIPRRLLPFGSLRVAFKALIASLLMAMVILSLHTLHIFVILPIAMLVYSGASLLLGTIPREDYLSVYHAIRQKKQPTSSSGNGNLPETPLPAYYPDTLLTVESVITMKLPAIRLQPMPETSMSAYTDALFAYELAITARLPAIRLQPMQQRSLKAIRLQPMPPHPLTQQRQDVPMLEESTGNYGDIVR